MRDVLDPQLEDGVKKCSARVSFVPSLEREPFRMSLELNFWGVKTLQFGLSRQAESAI